VDHVEHEGTTEISFDSVQQISEFVDAQPVQDSFLIAQIHL
jgi:hypothetical protein